MKVASHGVRVVVRDMRLMAGASESPSHGVPDE